MANQPRKILYISGTRADYGLMRQTLFFIEKEPGLKIEIAAGGMHLMPQFGRTINEIRKDGFKIHLIKSVYENDDKESMARFIGEFILGLLAKIKDIKPDIILVLGDRAEMLAGAIVGAYLTIPVCHLHGGEITSTVDEISRQAITRLAHIHLATTKKAAQRIIKMGEDKKRVYLVGAPGIDDIAGQKQLTKKDVCQKLGIKQDQPILLVLQHAVTLEIEKSAKQMKETLEAVLEVAKEIKGQVVIVYPNADAGGRKMIKVIEQYQKYPFLKTYKSLARELYVGLMKNAAVLIGNSSSGLIEAPSLKLAVVNIGTRQNNREKAENVIAAGYDKNSIKGAIKKALSKEFREKLKKVKNPYGNGQASKKITQILVNLKINNELLDKKLNL